MASTSEPTVSHSGWLTKRGALKKSWKRRYFVLDAEKQRMSYFKKDPSAKKKTKLPIAIIPLHVYTYVAPVDESVHQKDHEFQISGAGLRTFFMAADSEEEKDAWMNVFQGMGMKLVPAGEEPPSGVYHAGWLYKMGEFHRTWRRRYFVLDGAAVSYHESVDDAQVGRRNGSFTLKDYETLDLVDEGEHGKPFEFCVTGPGRRTYYMAATTETDLLDWIDAFLKVARLEKTERLQAFVDRNGYRVTGPNETGGYAVVAAAETPAKVIDIPPSAPVSYVVKVINGHQSFHLTISTEQVSFVSRSNVKNFPFTQIYSYDFQMTDGVPVITLHPRVPGTRKCKVYKIVPENEAILHHVKARFEAMIQLVIESRKLFVTVKKAFVPVSEKDVAVDVGEEVTIVKTVKSGDLLIRKKDGTAGTIPVDCVDMPKAARLKAKKGRRQSKVPVAAAGGIGDLVADSGLPANADVNAADAADAQSNSAAAPSASASSTTAPDTSAAASSSSSSSSLDSSGSYSSSSDSDSDSDSSSS
ncbi:uncharacterized protein AMSG_06758 [Thecamonas trahens ATCC 50062]|uniref:PH domain-containing protein n=1 Tax=Thecamonas trahens ATCC 50062 TaxID=461836 RepID=A0A0L0DEZ1_THETB|nr:hypothetical protein AMSG_06758 [Thecamonas trahens ATCC 50062]KNC50854.1 hypothetical protein AMSG_06758 [Thecamonas trahens ATCC 50062]|eukprot:XP_013756806.1 hypothetical protein AMSG_06758 [Thecamonas trahens ATCC 50062]